MKRHLMASTAYAGSVAALAACPIGPRIMFKNEDGGGSDKTDDVSELVAKLAKATEKVIADGTELQAKMKEGTKITSELKESVDKALLEQGELRGRITELSSRAQDLEQKAARRTDVAGGYEQMRTPGEIFMDDPDVKAFLAQGSMKARGRVRADMAAILTGGFTGLIAADRRVGIVALPERRMTVRDLITPGRTSSNAVQYYQQTGFTNAADSVSEGTTKPESTLTGELKTANVTTIAHIMIASKQILDDSPALQSLIDGLLRYGLAYEEEQQLLLGDGSGTQILGIIPQATAYSASFQPEMMQRIDVIRLALLQSEIALLPATGIVVHLIDWARIELTKDNEGRYVFAMPQNESTPRLWGRPVVSTPAMTAGDFLVGAFRLGAQIFDREDANVMLSTEDDQNFRKNLVTLRAEERLALAVYRPEAFTKGTFQTTT